MGLMEPDGDTLVVYGHGLSEGLSALCRDIGSASALVPELCWCAVAVDTVDQRVDLEREIAQSPFVPQKLDTIDERTKK
jgi:hypothetical protein